MQIKKLLSLGLISFLFLGLLSPSVLAQTGRGDGSAFQRLEVLTQKMDTMRKGLKSAISSLKKDDKENAESPRARLVSLEKEANALNNDVHSLRGKVERSEKYDASELDKLEVAISDFQKRYETTLQETAEARSSIGPSNPDPRNKKKPRGIKNLFGLFGRGNEEYEELVGTVAPGRDRVLFAMATKEVRKGQYEVGRLLYQTIVTTYPDSPFLAMAKLAIADSFYLEGGTSNLIQAAASYKDWLTFFPTHYLSDRVLLKEAESQMRQILRAGNDPSAARRAEQRLKVHLQQYPKSEMRDTVEERLKEVQENLAEYTRQIGDFYYEKAINQDKPGLKGAQNRYREILEKFPNYSRLDIVLYKVGVTYMQEEETDEAAKYFQRVVRRYPWSEFRKQAIEQLNIIGAEVPETDPDAANSQAPEKKGMFTNVTSEMFGIVNIKVDKNGVLISKDFKEEQRDLIDDVIANQGELPDSRMPKAPTTARPKGTGNGSKPN